MLWSFDAKPDRREHGLNWVGLSRVTPVLRREVVERQQHVTVVRQVFARRGVFPAVFFEQGIERFVRVVPCLGLPDLVRITLRFGLNALGHSAKRSWASCPNKGCLMDPAA